MNINDFTESQVRGLFQCGNSGCECHKGKNVHCPCPGHANNDKKPSLSITKKDGKVLVHCFVCDDKETIFKAVTEKLKQHYGDNYTSQKREGGLTLQELSEVKKIPIENLKQWHIKEHTKGKKPYVIIPFYDENNKLLSTQFRFSIDERPKWKKGDKPQLYGLWLLPKFQDNYIVIVEGSSDSWTMWLHDIQAIGIPSKTGWRSGYAEYFKRFQNVYLWQEPDATKLPGIIDKDIPGLKVLRPDGFKDISEAHIQGLDVKENVQKMIAQAIHYEHVEVDDVEDIEQEDKPKNGHFWIWKYDKKEKAWIVKIYDYGFIKFLQENGFGLLKMNNNYLYIFVNKETNLVKTFEPYQAKKFAMDYLEKLNYDKKEDVTAALHNASDRLIKNNSLNSLRFCDIEFLKDTQDTAYFLFQNVFVSVTKDDIKLHDYSKLKALNKFIWETQINKHDFRIDNDISVFEKFLENVSSYHLTDNELEMETTKGEGFTEGKKGRWLKHSDYLSKVTAFGYLLHTYKDASDAKAIVCVDAEITDSQEGGTGKSLFACKAISEVKNVKECDGKKFISGERFSFQGVNPSTQIIAIDDCDNKFDFEGLFHSITGDLVVEEKHKPEYLIPFKDSPKFTLTTNHVLKGDGHSHERRQHIIEFSDFYVKEGKPQDVHGGSFFDTWSANEYNRFYTFSFKCLQEYLKQGLVTQKTRNYELKKLFSATPEELITWFDKNIELDTEYVKAERYEKMKSDIPLFAI